MAKPITEWGVDELKAMFAGLPEGAVVARKGNYILVASSEAIEVESDQEVYTSKVWPYFTDYGDMKYKIVCHLGHSSQMFKVELPNEVNFHCLEIDEAIAALRKLERRRAASKTGLR